MRPGSLQIVGRLALGGGAGPGGGWGEAGQSVRQSCIVASLIVQGEPAPFPAAAGQSSEGVSYLHEKVVAPDALCLADHPASAAWGSVSRSTPSDDFRHVRHLGRDALPVARELRGGSRCALSRRTPAPRRCLPRERAKGVYQRPARLTFGAAPSSWSSALRA